MRIKRQNKGFTLLEILLVIAAIGILASIVLVAINPNRQLVQARNLVRQLDINTIQKALEQYLIDNGRYPNSVSTTPGYICNTGTEQTGGGTNCSGRVDLRELVPTYIAGIPKDPQATGTNTGYNVVINPSNNKVGVSADLAESKLISINPYVINNGLVLHLDAGNPASYPGTGNTWFDLSGNGNNGTLVNGVGYNSANGGSLVFDGVNDYVNMSNSNGITNSSELTGEMFVKINGTSIGSANWGGQYLFFKGNSRTSNFEGFSMYYRQNNNSFALTSTPSSGTPQATVVSNVISPGVIYHVVATAKSNDSVKMYINGVLQGSINILHGLDLPSVPTAKIGRSVESFEGPANATIYNIRIYNRALTPEEIQQNFNATRGRFGL